MSFNILVPKRSVRKDRSGGGSSFRDTFWQNFLPEESYKYTDRLSEIKESTREIYSSQSNATDRIYSEVKLDKSATSKSTRPSLIWEKANIDVVSSTDNLTFTLSGEKQDYEQLENLLSGCSFDIAKESRSTNEIKISREIMSICNLRNKGHIIEGRVDENIKLLISDEDKHQTLVECLIELYPDLKKTSYNPLYNKLEGVVGVNKIHKRDLELLFFSLSYKARLTITEIISLLENDELNFIQRIVTEYKAGAERNVPSIELNDIGLDHPYTSQVVGIIDSGINSSLLNPLVVNQYNYLPSNLAENVDHGTMVASRAVFGEEIFNSTTGGSLRPAAKIIDIKVLGQNSVGDVVAEPETLKKAILETVRRHRNVKIFNLSIGIPLPISEDIVNEITSFIDHVAREYDVTFVISAGNHQAYKQHNSYGDIFKDASTFISAPGDALNAITVGSISGTVNSRSICIEENYPSPFTRKGAIRGNQKKPELVANGGNVKYDPSGLYDNSFALHSNNEFGVEVITPTGLGKDVGTSLSAPAITNQCIQIAEYFDTTNIAEKIKLENNRANLTKALLVHSTSFCEQTDIPQKEVKHAYGFGLSDYKKTLTSSEHEITMVYCDTIEHSDKIHKFDIELPTELIGKSVEYVFTLVYNPPVNPNYSHAYKMIDLKPNLRPVEPGRNPRTGAPKDIAGNFSIDSTWENYKNKNFNTFHFHARQSRVTKPLLQVIITMTAEKEYENSNLNHFDRIKQPYAFVLTIIDKTETINLLRTSAIRNQFEELIEVEHTIQIES